MSNYYPTALKRSPQGIRGGTVRKLPLSTRRALPRAPRVYRVPAPEFGPRVTYTIAPELEELALLGRFGRFLPVVGTALLAFELGYEIGLWLFAPQEPEVQNFVLPSGWTAMGSCATHTGPHLGSYNGSLFCGALALNQVDVPADAGSNYKLTSGVDSWKYPFYDPPTPTVPSWRYTRGWSRTRFPAQGDNLTAAQRPHWDIQPYRPPVWVMPEWPQMPWPDWWPVVDPGVVPIGQPVPLPLPVPFPVAPAKPPVTVPAPPVVAPAPDAPPVADPPLPRPPGRGVKERKVQIHPVLAWTLKHVVNHVTERIDDIMCAQKALPKGLKPKPVWVKGGVRPAGGMGGAFQKPSKVGKPNWRWTPKGWVHEIGYYRAPTMIEVGTTLYRHFDKLDVGKFLMCLAANEVEDSIIGWFGTQQKQRLPGLGKGPAL